MKIYMFWRNADGPDHPAGYTVSKHKKLPKGNFRVTEYKWGEAPLWFVDQDEFTADERQAAFNEWQYSTAFRRWLEKMDRSHDRAIKKLDAIEARLRKRQGRKP